MSGISDIIAYGFGSWSTVAKVPTLGFGIGISVAAVSHYHDLYGADVKPSVLVGSPVEPDDLHGADAMPTTLRGPI